MKHQTEEGFVSLQFLFLLLFLSILLAGIGLYFYPLTQVESRERRKNEAVREIRGILAGVLQDLSGDPSPEINGRDDPLWAWDGKTLGAYTVSLVPLSDRLNPNFIRKNLFEKTDVSALLKPGRTPEELQQFREDWGLSLSPEFYDTFFVPAAWDRYLSPYGWANINLVDEFAARKLALSITGSEQKAEEIRRLVEQLLMNQTPADRASLGSALGSLYDEVFPFINAEPLMNINHIEPAILTALLRYPDYGVGSPEARAEAILARRDTDPLGSDDLLRLLGIAADNPLAAYLGPVTWFWEVTITGAYSCRAVICRLPPEALNSLNRSPELSGQAPRITFKIIEERFQ
jgi:hypothetical protein